MYVCMYVCVYAYCLFSFVPCWTLFERCFFLLSLVTQHGLNQSGLSVGSIMNFMGADNANAFGHSRPQVSFNFCTCVCILVLWCVINMNALTLLKALDSVVQHAGVPSITIAVASISQQTPLPCEH